MSSMRHNNERALIDAFTDTLFAPCMRLHVSYDTLHTQFLHWPGVEQCSDLHVTLTLGHAGPEWSRRWLLAEKIRAGPLRLRFHVNCHESWHGIWEASGQRLLMVWKSSSFLPQTTL